MKELEIVRLGKEQAEEAADLLPEDITELLEKGLPVTALAAVLNGRVVGALAGILIWEEFEIASIFVHPAYRRKGAGRELIRVLSDILEETDAFLSAEFTEPQEAKSGLEPFFRGLGFEDETDFYPVYLTAPLSDLRVHVRAGGSEYDDILSFSDAPAKLLSDSNSLKGAGLTVPAGAFTASGVDRDASFLALKNNRIIAYAVVRKVDKKTIRIDADGTGGPDMGEVYLLLYYAAEELRERYLSSTRVVMLSHSPERDRMIRRVLRNPVSESHRLIKKYPDLNI